MKLSRISKKASGEAKNRRFLHTPSAKKASGDWTVGKLVSLVLLVLFIALVVWGFTTNAMNPLIDRTKAMYDGVMSFFGVEKTNGTSTEGIGTSYVYMGSCVGGDSQSWKTYNTLAGGSNSQILSNLDGRCLDVQGGGEVKSGARVIVFDCKNADNQKWIFEKQGDGKYLIKSMANRDLCLDIRRADPGIGAELIVFGCDGNKPHQKWYLVGNQIKSALNNLCLEVLGACSKSEKREESKNILGQKTKVEYFEKCGGCPTGECKINFGESQIKTLLDNGKYSYEKAILLDLTGEYRLCRGGMWKWEPNFNMWSNGLRLGVCDLKEGPIDFKNCFESALIGKDLANAFASQVKNWRLKATFNDGKGNTWTKFYPVKLYHATGLGVIVPGKDVGLNEDFDLGYGRYNWDKLWEFKDDDWKELAIKDFGETSTIKQVWQSFSDMANGKSSDETKFYIEFEGKTYSVWFTEVKTSFTQDQLTEGGAWEYDVAPYITYGGNRYAYDRDRLYVSYDKGDTWSLVDDKIESSPVTLKREDGTLYHYNTYQTYKTQLNILKDIYQLLKDNCGNVGK